MTTDKINPNKNEAYDAIVTRTSVRQYLNDAPVPEVLVEALLRAAMSAPTAVNSQPWAFVVVNDRDVLDRLGAALPYARMLSRAPLAIVSCGVGDKFLSGDDEPLWVQDLSAASENILIAANAFGLGAVWTSVFPHADREKTVRDILGLPADIYPLNVIVVGRPARKQQPRDKWNPDAVQYNHG